MPTYVGSRLDCACGKGLVIDAAWEHLGVPCVYLLGRPQLLFQFVLMHLPYIYIYAHVYMYTYICICIYMCIYIYVYVHLFTHMNMPSYMYIHV